MQLTERKFDVVTEGELLEDLHTLTNFPVFAGVVDHSYEEDLKANMVWSISHSSGLIQLKYLLPLDILYQTQTTTNAIGPTWMQHHKEFAKFILNYNPNSVFEIGGAHGILSVEYSKYKDIEWTILEPNPSPVNECKAKIIKGFFDNEFNITDNIDTVIHSHVFEHLYEPVKFLKQLESFIKKGQKMLFSVPNLQSWLTNKFTNAINFEHTVYLTEPYIDYLLAKYGFKILEKKFVLDGHSIFYATVRDSNKTTPEISANLYYENKKTYLDFVDYYEKLVINLNNNIYACEDNVFLFGAHIFSQHLIVCGLNTEMIRGILDNDIRKVGKRLYGTHLKVQHPTILKNMKNVKVILKAGIYNNEIKKDILENINRETEFLE
jgi:2-polyprenyl-3-methyl-5-hydroxy-6-metoxy-1,4-benzoquinol methylase